MKNAYSAILTLALAAGVVAAAESANKDDVKIPPEAVKVDANTSRYTDAQGKTWIYRRTPFGVRRYEEKASESAAGASAAPQPEMPVNITVREEGETLHFERPTPFGVRRWSRKKSELNEQEKMVWERSRQSAPAAPKKDEQKEE